MSAQFMIVQLFTPGLCLQFLCVVRYCIFSISYVRFCCPLYYFINSNLLLYPEHLTHLHITFKLSIFQLPILIVINSTSCAAAYRSAQQLLKTRPAAYPPTYNCRNSLGVTGYGGGITFYFKTGVLTSSHMF